MNRNKAPLSREGQSMKTKLFIRLIALGFVLVFSRSQADEIDYWKTYNTTNSDLANNKILSLAVDSSANLWVGTDGGGVCKFDGVNWTTYTNAQYGGANNVVQSVAVAPCGDVWIALGSSGNSASKYDVDTKSWSAYTPNVSNVYAIDFDLNGNVLFAGGTSATIGAIWMYEEATDTWTNKTSQGKQYKGLAVNSSGDFFSMYYPGYVYKYSLSLPDPHWLTAWQQISGLADPFDAGSEMVKNGMAIDVQGDLWIATYYTSTDGGLLRYDEGGDPEWSIFHYDTPSVPAGALPSDALNSLATDYLGNVWVGASNIGVSKYNVLTGTWMASPYSPDNPTGGLASNYIYAIAADKFGTVWFGTSNAGVSRRSTFSIAPRATQTGAVITQAVQGDSFWIDIYVSDVEDYLDLYGTSLILEFEDDTVSIVTDVADHVKPGTLLDPTPANLVFFYNDDDIATGQLALSVSRTSGAGVSGSGTAAHVCFKSDVSTISGSVVKFALSSVVSTNSTGSNMFLPINEFTLTIVGPDVWPGDADNDGDVDIDDVDPITDYWHVTGYVRIGASRAWTAQPCQTWDSPNENATWADCDGNGEVNQADILPIGLNWGQTTTLLLASAGNLPAISCSGLDALRADLRAIDESAGIYELSLEIDPRYLDVFQGLSFAASGTGGAEIVNVKKGEAWSAEALYFNNSANGKCGVAITEMPNGSSRAGSGACLARIIFRAPAAGLDLSSMISLSEIKVSLINGEVVTVENPVDYLLAQALAQPSLPRTFALKQNVPNPFNPSTTFSYSVPEGESINVSLKIYDLRGQLVRILEDRQRNAGTYYVQWDGTNTTGKKVSSGVYFYRMQAGHFVQTRKLVLLK